MEEAPARAIKILARMMREAFLIVPVRRNEWEAIARQYIDEAREERVIHHER